MSEDKSGLVCFCIFLFTAGSNVVHEAIMPTREGRHWTQNEAVSAARVQARPYDKSTLQASSQFTVFIGFMFGNGTVIAAER